MKIKVVYLIQEGQKSAFIKAGVNSVLKMY